MVVRCFPIALDMAVQAEAVGSSPISGSHFLSYLDGKLFDPMVCCLDFSLALQMFKRFKGLCNRCLLLKLDNFFFTKYWSRGSWVIDSSANLSSLGLNYNLSLFETITSWCST